MTAPPHAYADPVPLTATVVADAEPVPEMATSAPLALLVPLAATGPTLHPLTEIVRVPAAHPALLRASPPLWAVADPEALTAMPGVVGKQLSGIVWTRQGSVTPVVVAEPPLETARTLAVSASLPTLTPINPASTARDVSAMAVAVMREADTNRCSGAISEWCIDAADNLAAVRATSILPTRERCVLSAADHKDFRLPARIASPDHGLPFQPDNDEAVNRAKMDERNKAPGGV